MTRNLLVLALCATLFGMASTPTTTWAQNVKEKGKTSPLWDVYLGPVILFGGETAFGVRAEGGLSRNGVLPPSGASMVEDGVSRDYTTTTRAFTTLDRFATHDGHELGIILGVARRFHISHRFELGVVGEMQILRLEEEVTLRPFSGADRAEGRRVDTETGESAPFTESASYNDLFDLRLEGWEFTFRLGPTWRYWASDAVEKTGFHATASGGLDMLLAKVDFTVESTLQGTRIRDDNLGDNVGGDASGIRRERQSEADSTTKLLVGGFLDVSIGYRFATGALLSLFGGFSSPRDYHLTAGDAFVQRDVPTWRLGLVAGLAL